MQSVNIDIDLDCSLFAELKIVSQKRFSWPVCCCLFCLSDLAKENIFEFARDFVVQSKVTALFHHIQGVTEFPYKGGIWAVVHLALIVSDALWTDSAAVAGLSAS